MGRSFSSIASTSAAPSTANWNRWSGPQSTFAPRSSIVVSPPFWFGMTPAMAGRSMPSSVFSTKRAIAIKRAGVARADADIGAALLDEVDRHAHRRVALGAQRDRDRVVHLDDLVRVDDLDGRRRARRQRGLHLGLAPDQEQGRIRLVPQERKGGGNGDRNAVVTAHAIDGDSDRHRRLASATRTGRRSALARGGRTWGSMAERGVARWANRIRDGGSARPYSSFLVATTFLPR